MSKKTTDAHEMIRSSCSPPGSVLHLSIKYLPSVRKGLRVLGSGRSCEHFLKANIEKKDKGSATRSKAELPTESQLETHCDV